jgi:superfamily II DNA/RNA helicase
LSLTLQLDPPARQATEAGTAPATTSFEALGLSKELVDALKAGGIHAPFAIQELVIADALAGRDVCGKAKTGSGKTLAFGLPLLQRTTTAKKRRPTSLILVPTRELATQVATELAPLAEARGLWLTAIYGGASMVMQIKALHAGVEIVIATPGRLNDLLDRKELSLADVTTVVVDEADQMADMGFLPQVKAILDRIEDDHQTLLFSATLDGAVASLIERYQHDPVTHEVASPTVTVDTLEQRFIAVEAVDKLKVAAAICAASERTMVFVRTKHGADRLARQLSTQGVTADAIHGGHNQNRRERTLAAFVAGRLPVLVATNVAARGIHVDAVEIVLHFDLPEDGKTYLHRSGRTARAGAEGLVVTLVQPEEMRDAKILQREAGVNISIVHMNSTDERLRDLAAWQPPAPQPIEQHIGNVDGYSGNRPAANRRQAGRAPRNAAPAGGSWGNRPPARHPGGNHPAPGQRRHNRRQQNGW